MAPTLLTNRKTLLDKFLATRKRTLELCDPLEKEDYVPQPIMDVSPPRWHLAHTTWFFEVFLLEKFQENYEHFHPLYSYLFNSYYQNVGDQWARQDRGNLSRPTVDEIMTFRKAIDERMEALFEKVDEDYWPEFEFITNVGINHEQQHQELLLYDLKYILCNNPVKPVYNPRADELPQIKSLPDDYKEFTTIGEGVYEVGYQGDGFCYDNELPVQKVYLHEFELRKGLVTNEEYLQFVKEGGYEDFNYWLDDGWAWLKENQIKQPLYWFKQNGKWHEMTLNGAKPLNHVAPVTHISFYEAEAFASWAGLRLPTEFEWEIAGKRSQPERELSNLQDNNIFHPMPPLQNGQKLYQMYGDVWEWTNSAYLPYHGFQTPEGALGEYNGKFMVNQMVLKGGSCATPANHIRKTYRNFFHPDKRWIFSGIRLAK